MNTRKMGVVTLLMMFAIIGLALTGGSSNPGEQDVVVVSATAATVAAAGVAGRSDAQLDRR